VIREILDAWAYWLADQQFAPADEALHLRICYGRQTLTLTLAATAGLLASVSGNRA